MSIIDPPQQGVKMPPGPLTAVSLFAGVEGIGLALKRAGVNVTAAVELDDAARGVIADRCPETTLFADVTKVTADELRATGFVPERGIVTAGWPCQGNSVAGGRKGLADPRSGLWSHVVRLLADLRPRWFLGENVPGLLSVTDGEDFGIVLRDLGELGMGYCYRVVDAQFFGVPQRRRRVFVVGDSRGTPAGPVQVLLEPEGGGGNPPTSRQAGQGIAATLTRGSAGTGVSAPGRRQEDDVNLVVETASTLQGGGKRGHRIDAESAAGGHLVVSATGLTAHTLTSEGADASEDGTGRGTPVVAFAWQAGGNNSASGAINEEMSPTLPKSQTMAVQTPTAVRRLTPLECERLQGFPDNWTLTSNGKPQADSARYRQMGNAVAVPCVEWIARRLVAVDGSAA